VVGKCAFCNELMQDGYQLIAIDGIHTPGKVTELDPLFDGEGRRLYKNLFVHRHCVTGLKEKLKEMVKDG